MHITRAFIHKNPNTIFVFGDNDLRRGLGGQAKECRGEPNAIGIRVKKAPSMKAGSFYTDDEYEENCKKIQEDIETIKKAMIKIGVDKVALTVFPRIGLGRARLDKEAPKTFEFFFSAMTNLGHDVLCGTY